VNHASQRSRWPQPRKFAHSRPSSRLCSWRAVPRSCAIVRRAPRQVRRRPEIVESFGVQTALHVIPAKAGTEATLVPAFAGMTEFRTGSLIFGRRLRLNADQQQMAQMHADGSWVPRQRSQTQLSVRPEASGGGLRPICVYQRHPLLICVESCLLGAGCSGRHASSENRRNTRGFARLAVQRKSF